MGLVDIFRIAVRALGANVSRSLLTILGIVIGITSIMLIVSVGQGAKALILGQLEGFGSKTLFVEPGREPSGPSDLIELYTDSLKEKDVTALSTPGNVPGITDVSPEVIGNYTVNWRNENTRASTIGTTKLFAEILEVFPKEGIFFTDEDVRQRATVAVLGSKVREKLFGESEAVGQIIKIKNVNFKVIGIVPRLGTTGFFNVDDFIMVPYTAAQQYLTGTDFFQAIVIRVEREDIIDRVALDIAALLRANHGISDPDKDDFHITTPADAADRVSVVTGVLTALLTAVAAISLVVGGIGIMNIMLVSVTERTREIGLRKAVGATNRDILSQFLLEAVLLTATGGMIGIVLGVLLGYAASFALSSVLGASWQFVFPVQAMIIGLVMSAGVGIAFGLYPARRAARLDPVEALRYE